jgi:hypothetical protein
LAPPIITVSKGSFENESDRRRYLVRRGPTRSPRCGATADVSARIIDNLHRRAKAFGFVLQPKAPTPEMAVS